MPDEFVEIIKPAIKKYANGIYKIHNVTYIEDKFIVEHPDGESPGYTLLGTARKKGNVYANDKQEENCLYSEKVEYKNGFLESAS